VTKPRVVTLLPQLCDKCMSCVRVCPKRAIEGAGAFVVIDSGRCDGCGKCVTACGPGALVLRAGGPAVAGKPSKPKAVAKAAPAAKTTPAAKPKPSPKPAAPTSADRVEAPGTPFSAPWTGWETAFVLVGLLVLFAVRMSAWNSAWMTETVPPGAKPLMRAGVLVLYYTLQLAMLTALGIRKGTGFAAAFGLRAIPVNRYGAVVGMFLLTRVFQVVFGVTVILLGWKDAGGATLTSYFGRDVVGLWLTLLMVVVVGPFFEEVVFRGVLINYLLPRTGVFFAILLSSILFASYHFNAWAFAPVMVMGVAATSPAIPRRSVWPAYALHAGYNAIAVILAFAPVGK
jgi:membrane protease YdiL (CAAX protease family)/NAD-dependent dihydropyrimidine dehydrogenase PreA subunit